MTGIAIATAYPAKRYSAATSAVRYAADGLPAGVNTPMIVISPWPSFSTMCTCRGRSLNAAPAPSGPASVLEVQSSRAFGDPDDLVVQVVVPRRLAGRDEAGEEGRPRRPVVRPEQELEGARPRRLLRVAVVERDGQRAGAHGCVEVGRRPDRRENRLELRRRRERRVLARENEPGAALANRYGLGAGREQPRAAGDVQEGVVLGLAELHTRAELECQRPQCERRALERADVEWVVHEAGM